MRSPAGPTGLRERRGRHRGEGSEHLMTEPVAFEVSQEGNDLHRTRAVRAPGEIEDDPNITDELFPGNPTCSYRTLAPVRVGRELEGKYPKVV